MNKILLRLVVVVAVSLGMTAAALAWSSYSSFDVEAAGVTFSGVELSSPNAGNRQCRVRVRLKANVPDTGARTFFVTLNNRSGKSILKTVPFKAARSGSQWVTFWHDTSHSGCWASSIQTPKTLNVRGCKGQGCTP